MKQVGIFGMKMAVLIILLCFTFIKLMFGLNIHNLTCVMGTKRPSPLETTELDTKDFDVLQLQTNPNGVTLDPCQFRENSILQITWNNSRPLSRLVLCVKLNSMLHNITTCFSVSHMANRKTKSRKFTCWLRWQWSGVTVINVSIYSGNTKLTGGVIFTKEDACRDICGDNFPQIRGYMTCGELYNITVSKITTIMHVSLRNMKHEHITVDDASTKSSTLKELLGPTGIDSGLYTMKILATLQGKPFDHSCRFEKQIYLECDETPKNSIQRPATVPAVPVQGKMNNIYAGLTIVISVLLVAFVAMLVFLVRRTFLQSRRQETDRPEAIPMNSIEVTEIDEPINNRQTSHV